MAVRTLWKFVVGRAKTLMKNYNVIERAEKVMESDKRASPRHPGTEAKFKVLIKGCEEFKSDMEKKPVELLDRLKIVKVSSEDGVQDNQKENRPLPQVREQYVLPTFGYEEPISISEGSCSLRQAVEFISKHQNDPSSHTTASIAETYNMKSSDVQNIINNFRAFQLYVQRDRKIGFTNATMKALGANKIIQPLYNPKFKDMLEDDAKNIGEEKK